MNKDYTYCFNEDTCIHRRGCKRWLGNYSEDEVEELYSGNRLKSDLDSTCCLDDIPYPYDSLDRFRLSDGSPLK